MMSVLVFSNDIAAGNKIGEFSKTSGNLILNGISVPAAKGVC